MSLRSDYTIMQPEFGKSQTSTHVSEHKATATVHSAASASTLDSRVQPSTQLKSKLGLSASDRTRVSSVSGQSQTSRFKDNTQAIYQNAALEQMTAGSLQDSSKNKLLEDGLNVQQAASDVSVLMQKSQQLNVDSSSVNNNYALNSLEPSRFIAKSNHSSNISSNSAQSNSKLYANCELKTKSSANLDGMSESLASREQQDQLERIYNSEQNAQPQACCSLKDGVCILSSLSLDKTAGNNNATTTENAKSNTTSSVKIDSNVSSQLDDSVDFKRDAASSTRNDDTLPHLDAALLSAEYLQGTSSTLVSQSSHELKNAVVSQSSHNLKSTDVSEKAHNLHVSHDSNTVQDLDSKSHLDGAESQSFDAMSVYLSQPPKQDTENISTSTMKHSTVEDDDDVLDMNMPHLDDLDRDQWIAKTAAYNQRILSRMGVEPLCDPVGEPLSNPLGTPANKPFLSLPLDLLSTTIECSNGICEVIEGNENHQVVNILSDLDDDFEICHMDQSTSPTLSQAKISGATFDARNLNLGDDSTLSTLDAAEQPFALASISFTETTKHQTARALSENRLVARTIIAPNYQTRSGTMMEHLTTSGVNFHYSTVEHSGDGLSFRSEAHFINNNILEEHNRSERVYPSPYHANSSNEMQLMQRNFASLSNSLSHNLSSFNSLEDFEQNGAESCNPSQLTNAAELMSRQSVLQDDNHHYKLDLDLNPLQSTKDPIHNYNLDTLIQGHAHLSFKCYTEQSSEHALKHEYGFTTQSVDAVNQTNQNLTAPASCEPLSGENDFTAQEHSLNHLNQLDKAAYGVTFNATPETIVAQIAPQISAAGSTFNKILTQNQTDAALDSSKGIGLLGNTGLYGSLFKATDTNNNEPTPQVQVIREINAYGKAQSVHSINVAPTRQILEKETKGLLEGLDIQTQAVEQGISARQLSEQLNEKQAIAAALKLTDPLEPEDYGNITQPVQFNPNALSLHNLGIDSAQSLSNYAQTATLSGTPAFAQQDLAQTTTVPLMQPMSPTHPQNNMLFQMNMVSHQAMMANQETETPSSHDGMRLHSAHSVNQVSRIPGLVLFKVKNKTVSYDAYAAEFLGIGHESGSTSLNKFIRKLGRRVIKQLSQQLKNLKDEMIISEDKICYSKNYINLSCVLPHGMCKGATVYLRAIAFFGVNGDIKYYSFVFMRQIPNNMSFIPDLLTNNTSFAWLVKEDRISLDQHYYKLLGYPEQNEPLVLDFSTWENTFIHPHDRAVIQQLMPMIESPDQGNTFELCYRSRKVNGTYIWTKSIGNVIARDRNGKAARVIGINCDINEMVDGYDRLRTKVYTDVLTGLKNRTYLIQHVKDYIQPQMQPLSILFFDATALKMYNDYLGHSVGDKLLFAIANILHENIAFENELIRISGDEIICVLPMCDELMLQMVMEDINVALESYNSNAPVRMPVFFSMGNITFNLNTQLYNRMRMQYARQLRLHEMVDPEHHNNGRFNNHHIALNRTNAWQKWTPNEQQLDEAYEMFFQSVQIADKKMQEAKRANREKHYALIQAYIEHTLHKHIDVEDKRLLNIDQGMLA